MTHKIAKLILEHAESITDRKTAIQKAMELGMSSDEVNEYLDWLDNMRLSNPKPESASESKSKKIDTGWGV